MSTTPAKTEQAQKDSPSKRFTEMVLKEYQVSTGISQFSPDQTRRVQNYFVKMDIILAENETKRLSKPEDKRDALAFNWTTVNLERFAQDVAIFSQLGLDPMMPNHINLIPYKNSRTNKFDIGFIRGYKGLEIVARNFAVVEPIDIICELVYSNDEFHMIKKDLEMPVESYRFNVPQPFNRGEIVGGFMYTMYEDQRMNTIEVMTVAEIEKRKPKYASVEFWGGEKTVYTGGKPSGKEVVEGWHKEMCQKTLERKAWGSITIDGSKMNSALSGASNAELVHESNLSATEDAIIIDEKPKTIEMNTHFDDGKRYAKTDPKIERQGIKSEVIPEKLDAKQNSPEDLFPESK